MQLENFATPPNKQSPQLRYASLHRAVEQGMASGEVWLELAEVCLELGHNEEAVRAWRTMPDGSARNRLESILARRRLIDPAEAPTPRAVAPSPAGDADEVLVTRTMDHVRDAVQYLFVGRLPLLALLATLTFPVIVGLGGFLTAGSSMFLLAGIAALPGLSVLGVVGALGRRILVASAKGEEEAPALPAVPELARAALRFLSDSALVIVAMLGPSLLMLLGGAPLSAALPGLLVGGFLLPMAHALRQVRDDYKAYAPQVLMPAIGHTLLPYAGICLAFWAMFLPVAAVLVWTAGMATWLQIGLAGPLAVLPVFVTARMLGTFLEVHRQELHGLLGAVPLRQAVEERRQPVAVRQALRRKPVTARPAPAPATNRPTGAAKPAPAAPAPSRPATRPSAAAPSSQPQPKVRAAAQPAAPARPAGRPVAKPTGLASYVAQADAAATPPRPKPAAQPKAPSTVGAPLATPAPRQPAAMAPRRDR